MTTRYGGRFLQSIDGIYGSLTGQRDWFFFVNGIEGDRERDRGDAASRATCSGGTTAAGAAAR